MMRQERLYVLVGLFVGGAISLTILLGLYIYDEYLHEKVETYVMFFKGSLSGIHVTSDVTYRGVKIGEVKLIEIAEDIEKNRIKVPVYVQFFVERKFAGRQNPIQHLIDRGYVANISKPNFLTNIASIDLIRNPTTIHGSLIPYKGYPIFPTNYKVEERASLDDAFKSAKEAFQNISIFIHSIHTSKVNEVLDATKNMAASIEKMVKTIDDLVPPTMTNFSESLKEFSAFTTHFTASLDQVVPLVSPTLNNFSRSMQQVSEAANSAENLTDYLLRNPESLIRGKR